MQNGTVTVDVTLDGDLPNGARPDLTVDGTIELERLTDVLFVGRPALGQEQSAVGLFKLDPDGTASRIQAKIGRMSVDKVELVSGLPPATRWSCRTCPHGTHTTAFDFSNPDNTRGHDEHQPPLR